MASNYEAAKLYQFLISPEADSLVMSFKGNKATQKNIQRLKGFYDFIQKLEQKSKMPSETHQEYERKRNEYVEKHAARDADGNIIREAAGTKLANVVEFNKDMEALMSSYKDVIEEHQAKLAEWEEYVHTDYEGKIEMIDEKDIEFSKLSKVGFEALQTMIIQPPDEEDQKEVSEDTES